MSCKAGTAWQGAVAPGAVWRGAAGPYPHRLGRATVRVAGLVMAVCVAVASPAQACHRFSIWKYPTAQRCAVVAQADEKPLPPQKPKDFIPPFTVSKYDTIILRPDPNRTDEEGRAQAIEILKQVMGK